MERPLVIGIGLPKTGTTSLTAALEQLGYRNVIHNPVELRRRWWVGDFTVPRKVEGLTTNGRWEPLCEFLGKPIPDAPFPHKNAGPKRKDLTPKA